MSRSGDAPLRPRLVFSQPRLSTPALERRLPPHLWEQRRRRAADWLAMRKLGRARGFSLGDSGHGGRSA